MSEAELYAPVKRFLEKQGYEVKGEIGACDVFAVRGTEDPIIVELKSSLSFALILQAVDRLALSPNVYIAFRIGKGHSATWRTRGKQVKALARRLGLGLLTVSARGKVVPVIDPGPYKPRQNKRKANRLLKEFAERVGDPESGGSSSRKRMTAYRQDALRCAEVLAHEGVLKASVVRDKTGVERAGAIFLNNHYGWFARVKVGYYELTERGEQEAAEWHELINATNTKTE